MNVEPIEGRSRAAEWGERLDRPGTTVLVMAACAAVGVAWGIFGPLPEEIADKHAFLRATYPLLPGFLSLIVGAVGWNALLLALETYAFRGGMFESRVTGPRATIGQLRSAGLGTAVGAAFFLLLFPLVVSTSLMTVLLITFGTGNLVGLPRCLRRLLRDERGAQSTRVSRYLMGPFRKPASGEVGYDLHRPGAQGGQ